AALPDPFPSSRCAPEPGPSPLRSPTVLSLRHAPRFGSKPRREVGNTNGPPAGTAAWDVALVPSIAGTAPRDREPLCWRVPPADTAGHGTAIPGETEWDDPSRHRRRSRRAAASLPTPATSPRPVDAESETGPPWAPRPPGDAPGPSPSPR